MASGAGFLLMLVLLSAVIGYLMYGRTRDDNHGPNENEHHERNVG